MTKNLIFGTLLATIIMVTLAPTLSILDNTFAQNQGAKPTDKLPKEKKEKVPKDKPEKVDKKDKDKVKNCQVKAQVKVFGAANGTTVTTQLETLIPQSKLQTKNITDPVTFNFQWKKGDITCPIKDELPKTVYGTANGEYFTGIIKSLSGNNKLTYELQGIVSEPQ